MKKLNQEYIDCFDHLYHELLKKNLTTYENYSRELDNLTSLDISIINIAAFNPDIIVREIAEILNIPNSTLTSALNRLEEKNLAHRIISKRDRRSFSIELTENGQKIQQKHLKLEREYFEDILNRLDSHTEIETFLKLFKKIVEHKKEGAE